jgi:hypothetical protein
MSLTGKRYSTKHEIAGGQPQMRDEPVSPDPADLVPPGERAALAHTAQDLIGEREDLAHTARELVGERAELAKVAKDLIISNGLLTGTVARLGKRLRFRTRLVGVIVALNIAIGVILAIVGYRSEHFLTCQVRQNTEFREAAKTELATQRKLFDVVLDPTSTPADKLRASQAYRSGLITAAQQRRNNDTAAENC